MKAKKCKQCNNETFQKDGICVICRIGITPVYTELVDLLKQDSKWDSRIHKTAAGR